MAGEYRLEKLIRDRIPEIIRRDGRDPDVRQVDDEIIRPFVGLKVIEEAFEVYEAFASGDRAKIAEEVADILEVLLRLLDLAGISSDEVESVRRAKLDQRGAFEQNYLLPDPPGQQRRLHADFETPLLPALEANLEICSKAYMAVSFIMKSGIDRLAPAMAAALARGAAIRVLTSDYLDITDPEALEELLLMPGDFEIKAYREPSRSYHPKAYIFEHPNGQGTAYVGSSNMSASALMTGIEWNYEVKGLDAGWPLVEIIDKFNALYDSPHSVRIDADFVEDYRQRRRPRTPLDEPPVPQAPVPRPAQVEALIRLEAMREQQERRAMVIAATGIGKTFLAAFDSRPFKRVLFLAHREELLTQAYAAFAQVRPDSRFGYYMAGLHDTQAEVLFASVGTLSRAEHYTRFAPDYFDYVVVDEFHHAAAKSYLALLHYFAPRFLLGLTATPYRGDNRDVFALCDGNVAYKVTFIEAIAMGWLCPFHYHGLYDETDYSGITWRNGRYDAGDLSRALENDRRATAILEAFQAHPSSAAVGFCVSIDHARFMADYFNRQGIPALAVHSGPDAPDRGLAIRGLQRGELRVLFTVDLFNEGVDIPEIDLVMFLRPTESVTIFLQQLGRGLRLHRDKAYLTVLDFIGNYKKAHYKLPLIAGRLDDEPDAAVARKLFEAYKFGALQAELPPGVELNFDLRAINLMERFAKQGEPRRERLALAYRDVVELLGHRPTMLEMHRWGREDVRLYRQEYGSWFGFLRSEQVLMPQDESLASEVGDFLEELEKTSMTRSFKMVVLESFLARGGLASPVNVEALTDDFRAFFAASERYAGDLGPEVADIANVAPAKLRAYLEKNPLQAWSNPGKGGKRVYFAYDTASGDFGYVGPRATDADAFEQAVRERVAYRLAEYFEVRFERKNVFNVINSGPDKGIIMLGQDDQSPIPRDGGWHPVFVQGRRWYAKFAKVAINVLKTSPDESREVPNQLTEVLEGMFGPGGFLPERGNRVRILPAAEDPAAWQIEPYQGRAH